MQEVGARSLVWELRSCMLWWGPKQFFFFNGRRLQMDNQRPTRWPCASCLCCPLLAYPRLVPANMLHAEPVPLSASVFLTPSPTPYPHPCSFPSPHSPCFLSSHLTSWHSCYYLANPCPALFSSTASPSPSSSNPLTPGSLLLPLPLLSWTFPMPAEATENTGVPSPAQGRAFSVKSQSLVS